MTRFVAALALCIFGLTACAYFTEDTDPTPPLRTGDNAAGGEDLYRRDCAWCHGSGGEGTTIAPDLVSGTNGAAFTHFMLTTGRMPLADADAPSERAEPVYNEIETRAIVEYVASLGGEGPAIPAVDPEDGNLGEGLELYQENCAACHAPTLVGGALATGPGSASRSIIAPGLIASSAQEVAEAMLVGPGTMPVFGQETFTDDQVNSVVAYVLEQQDPQDVGGAPIGHVGPVTEGAVAWLVGLALMVLLIRWIGTKRGEP